MMPSPFPDLTSWPYPPHYLPLEVGKLHYIRQGKGAPVLFVHGTPTWSYEWRGVLGALASTHQVTALDHLGFGLSDRPHGAEYSPEAHARRFGEAIEVLFPHGQVSLVLHDFGGPIALDWALNHPERVASIVLVNTWMWPFSWDPKMKRRAKWAGGWLSRLLYRRANASLRLIMPSAYGDRTRLTPQIHAQYLSPFPDPDSRERVLFALAKSLLGSEAFFSTLWERRERLAGVPVHLFWGRKDGAFPLTYVDRWREGVPHARIVSFEDAGHWPHEERPEAFSRALMEALSASTSADSSHREQ